MTGYLGMRPRTVAAVAAAALTVGATLGLVLPTRMPCGYVVEGAEVVPAACTSAADLDGRLSAIRADRAGGRW